MLGIYICMCVCVCVYSPPMYQVHVTLVHLELYIVHKSNNIGQSYIHDEVIGIRYFHLEL